MKPDWQARIFCEKLGQSSVSKLELAGVGIGDDFAAAFAELALSHNSLLREVNLGRNAIGPVGVLAIAAALPGSSLEVLRMNAQKKTAGNEAEGALAAAAAKCETLTKVNLDWKAQQHRSNCERALMQNADRARKRRQAAKAAAAAAEVK
mmetsp:Transcript_7487/g.19256  ORF Transcript_7487/g.19256 Transcript_7487/m.19256 type:complete len:150 (+) Transcript_7487:25-474(+)